jgi:Na+/melibiose symporter-like transporter
MMLVGKGWDAVTDPAMGYLTPRVQLGSASPVRDLRRGADGHLLLLPVRAAGALRQRVAWYRWRSACDLHLFTIFAGPTWRGARTRDYHERTAVVQVRGVARLVGGVAGAALPMVIVSRYADARSGFAAMALAIGSVVALVGLLCGVAVADRGRDRLPVPGMAHFMRGVRGTFANRDFRLIYVTFCLMTVSASMGTAIQLVVVKYRLQMYDQFPLFALTFGLCLALSFPLWMALSRRMGKSRAMRVGPRPAASCRSAGWWCSRGSAAPCCSSWRWRAW